MAEQTIMYRLVRSPVKNMSIMLDSIELGGSWRIVTQRKPKSQVSSAFFFLLLSFQEMSPKPSFIVDGISRFDFAQGQLGREMSSFVMFYWSDDTSFSHYHERVFLTQETAGSSRLSELWLSSNKSWGKLSHLSKHSMNTTAGCSTSG